MIKGSTKAESFGFNQSNLFRQQDARSLSEVDKLIYKKKLLRESIGEEKAL